MSYLPVDTTLANTTVVVEVPVGVTDIPRRCGYSNTNNNHNNNNTTLHSMVGASRHLVVSGVDLARSLLLRSRSVSYLPVPVATVVVHGASGRVIIIYYSSSKTTYIIEPTRGVRTLQPAFCTWSCRGLRSRSAIYHTDYRLLR